MTMTLRKLDKGDISFYIAEGGKEVVKFCANGDIYVHGRLVENDGQVVEGIREFLKSTGFHLESRPMPVGDNL